MLCSQKKSHHTTTVCVYAAPKNLSIAVIQYEFEFEFELIRQTYAFKLYLARLEEASGGK